MLYLEQFTEDQRALLVALPYRTGLWVSESDQSGGDESSEAEMMALEGIIMGYSEDFLKSEFVEELMRATMAHKSSWDKWQKNLDDVPNECERAVALLSERLDSREVLSFKQNLMEIATAVALAFCEVDESEGGVGKVAAYFNHYLAVLVARLKKQQQPRLESHLNISRAEREVLGKLSGVLQVRLDGSPFKTAVAA